MPKFSANLSMLYTEHDFLDRFAASAEDGFEGVEYIGPYDHPIDAVTKALKQTNQTQALFNLPAGNWATGERGIACLPDRISEFRAGIDTALAYAKALDCRQINCLSGIIPTGLPRADALRVLAENLTFAAPRLAEGGIRLLVEPINTYDMPGFALSTSREALDLLDKANHPNLWLQYDFYHMQRMQGALMAHFEAHQNRISHVQIADTPGRHEPGTGEINYRYILRRLDALGYTGWVGCEYIPRSETRAGLDWLKTHLNS